MTIPKPVFFMSVEPESEVDAPSLQGALDWMSREDPSVEGEDIDFSQIAMLTRG